MIIRKIEINGFRSHVGTKIDGLTKFSMLLGRNGAGKSTVLDAIAYVLTGTCRGTDDGGRGAEKLPTHGGGVAMHLSLDTDKGTLSRAVGQGPRSAAHSRIAKLTGLDQGMARVIVQPTQFMRLTPNEQKELLAAVVGSSISPADVEVLLGALMTPPGSGQRVIASTLTTIDGVNDVEKQLREKRPLLKHDLANCVYTMPAKMPGVEASPEILQESKDLLRDLELELSNKKGSVERESGRLSGLKSRKAELEARAASLDQQLAGLGDLATMQSMLKEAEARLSKAQAASGERDEKVRKIESEIAQAEGTLRVVQEQAAKAQALTSSCTHCGQSIPAEYAKQYLSDLRAKYRKLQEGIKKHREMVNELRQLPIGETPDQVHEDIASIKTSITELNQLQQRREEVARDLAEASKRLGESAVLPTQEEISTLEERIARGKHYVGEVEILLSERAKEQAVKAKRESLQAMLNWIEAMLEVVGPKGALRAKLMGGGLAAFLDEINALAGGLGLGAVDIRFEPWQITVGSLPAIMLSESELFRLSLAFAAVFAKRTGTGLLCVDGADILDPENRAMFADVLEASGLSQAIIAATGELPSEVPADGDWSYFYVSKDNGVSTVRATQGVAA